MHVHEIPGSGLRLEFFDNGVVQVRETKPNGEYHRFVVMPDESIPDSLGDAAVFVEMWRTPERVAVYAAQLQETVDG